jgi:hypothetical protein
MFKEGTYGSVQSNNRSSSKAEPSPVRTGRVDDLLRGAAIFVRLMNDEAFRNVAATHLMRAVYTQVRESEAVGMEP